jgi:GDPmannose 4,6-dehydratase/GDP-4-dehydro-6-deoxy-D-mannose reductase
MVGSHLAEFSLREHADVEVHGLVRWRSPLDNIRSILSDVSLHQAELRDLNSMIQLIDKVAPDRIHHLAAQSYVTTSFSAPADTLATNVIGTVNLMDAVRTCGLDPLIHICSSSEVYGQVTAAEVPIREDNPLRPASPYAVSKVGEDMAGLQYFLSYGLRTLRTRMFTHTGPRRGDVFAESAFARQIARIEAGIDSGPMRVGNLDSIRTFLDVRDAVRAYWALLDHGVPGEVYNIGGTRTMSVGDMLEILKGLSKATVEHVVDQGLLRPSDVTLQVPDVSKFQDIADWEPRIAIEQTLADLLDYQRERVGR